MDIQLSKNFKLSEFLYSDTVESRKSYDSNLFTQQNCIDAYTFNNIHLLTVRVLQPLRDGIGYPITINSGYRCNKLNLLVKGSATSQHKSGQAADITCFDNKFALDYIQKSGLDFDQLIVYGSTVQPRFLHISYDFSRNRKQILYKP